VSVLSEHACHTAPLSNIEAAAKPNILIRTFLKPRHHFY